MSTVLLNPPFLHHSAVDLTIELAIARTAYTQNNTYTMFKYTGVFTESRKDHPLTMLLLLHHHVEENLIRAVLLTK